MASAFDGEGDLFIGGNLGAGQLDLDPGVGTHTAQGPAQSYDLLLAKYTNAGQVLWSHVIGGEGSEAITTLIPDASGGVYVAGNFSHGSFDIDPGPEVVLLTGNGTVNNMFLAQFNATGQLLWASEFGASLGYIFPNAMALDTTGNILIAGSFGTNINVGIDMDPGPASATLVSFGQTDQNGFVAKYGPEGEFHWAFRIGGTADFEKCLGVTCDQEGNVHVVGEMFSADIDLDPGSSTYWVHVPNDRRHMLLASYTSTGEFRWGGTIGEPSHGSSVFGHDIASTGDGGFVATGGFTGTNIDFDPGPLQSGFSGNAAFLGKYTGEGNLEWLVPMDGAAFGHALGVAPDESILVGGKFTSESMQMGPMGPVFEKGGLTSDGFLGRFAMDGSLTQAFSVQSSEQAGIGYISSFGPDQFALCGSFRGDALQLDPTGPAPGCDAVGTSLNAFFAVYGQLQTHVPSVPEGSDLALFPNPVQPGTRLHLSSTGIPAHWRMTSADGMLVQEGLFGALPEIDIDKLTPGVYLLRVFMQNGEQVLRMVSVQR